MTLGKAITKILGEVFITNERRWLHDYSDVQLLMVAEERCKKRDYGVAANVVKKAMKRLIREGYLMKWDEEVVTSRRKQDVRR